MQPTTADQLLRSFRPAAYQSLGRRKDPLFERMEAAVGARGPVLKLADPTTHGTPDRTATCAAPVHGQVQVAVWEHLHVQAAADTPFTLVRIQVERLPRHPKRPKPRWLAWVGGPAPTDLLDLWHWAPVASSSSPASASSSTTWAGPPSARLTPRPPTAGAGCWPWASGPSG